MAESSRVLVVDDDPYVRQDLYDLLLQKGMKAEMARDGGVVEEMFSSGNYDLILLDLELPRKHGLDVLRWVRETQPGTEVIIVSGKATISQAIEATRLGAYDVLEKPVSAERVLVAVRNALEKIRLLRERDALLSAQGSSEWKMVGSSSHLRHVLGQIDRAASIDVRVLITGESGTGKELVARSIHEASTRSGNPFVAVNCSAIPESLIESHLFGHEKGAFTGALNQYHGKFEQADGGILFLDEISEMNIGVQAKLLRVLEDGYIERVGSTKPIHVDVRVLAATNRDLEDEEENGSIREDLYHRLNVVRIQVPALRDRVNDVPQLARHFSDLFCQEQGLAEHTLTDGAIHELCRYRWPGNVREVRNVIQRIIVENDGLIIGQLAVQKALSPMASRKVAASESTGDSLREARARFESDHIRRILEANDWQIQLTATCLGITRAHLWKKMQEYEIEKE